MPVKDRILMDKGIFVKSFLIIVICSVAFFCINSLCLHAMEGCDVYFDSTQKWIVTAYTEPGTPTGTYNVYLQVTGENGNSLPSGSVQGMTTNPFQIAADAKNPDVGLAFDDATSTAYVVYTGASGMMVQKALGIEPPCAPILAVSSESLPFNAVCTGTNTTKTISVCNNGNCPLNIIGITPPSAPFSISRNTCSSTVTPQACCEIDVRLSPTSANNYSSSVVINTNDGFATVGISGTAQSCGPKIQVTPNPLDFQSVKVFTSATNTIAVSNIGSGNLSVTSVGSPYYPYTKTQDTCSSKTLAPGASCTISIRFSPYSVATFNSSIAIKSSDVNVTVNLSGKGIN
jgi:hypothetical protein